MKQLLVANWQATGRVALTELQKLLDAQIENSLALGWHPENIWVVANFDYHRHGIRAESLDGMNSNCLRGSKMFALHRMFQTARIADDEIVWAHDLDAWQNHPFTPPAFRDLGLAEYSRPKFNGGSVFVRSAGRDMVARIINEIVTTRADREEPTINRVLREPAHRDRVTVLNSTFNLGCSGFKVRWERSDKPILVSHFHPTNRLAWETHMNDRNGLGESVTPRLKELLNRHFPRRPTECATKHDHREASMTDKRSVFPFTSYQEYLDTQRRRAKRSRGTTNSHAWFRQRLAEQLKRFSPEAKTMLCIGARSDVEVLDFRSNGFDATGIDLFASEHIIKCDMSRIDRLREFSDRTFDAFVAIHSLEHCLDFPGFLRGLAKCNRALACVVPQMTVPNQWDCSVHGFASPGASPSEIAVSFAGFKLAWSETAKKTLMFILVRE